MLQKKTYFFLLLIFIVLKLEGQILNISYSNQKKQDIERILEHSSTFGLDTIALKNYLQPLLHKSQFNIIYHATLANARAQVVDKINVESNYHYLKSIALAKENKDSSLEIWTAINYINYLYNYRDYPRLTPYFLEVIKKLRSIDPAKVIFAGESFKKISWILQTFNDYEDSLYYLNLAEKYTPKNTAEYASILNTIGKTFLIAGDLKKSANYFGQTAQMSKKFKDTINLAKSLGYLAEVKRKQGDLSKAISLLKQDIALSESCKNDKNTMYASIILSEIYIIKKDITSAKQYLKKAIFIAKSKSYFNISELKIIKLQLAIMKMQGVTDDELTLRRRLVVLEDSLKTKDGEMVIDNSNWIFKKNKFEQKIENTKMQYQQESLLKTIYAFVAIFAVILTLCLYYNFSKKIKYREFEYNKKVLSIEMDIIKIEKKLSEANEDLNTQIDYLKQKNVQIKKLKSEIALVKQSSSHYLEERNGKLTALLESHLMTENNWRTFKREFEKDYPDFFQLLSSEFKDITDSSMRILLLQKLNFSNSETAELLGVTLEAIKKSKQRLRKKLGTRYGKLEIDLN